MSELFDEVDEEVRREQLKRLWDKYSIFVIALLVLIIAGVGGWKAYEYYQAKQAGEAGAAFNASADLAEQNKRPEAAAAFDPPSTQPNPNSSRSAAPCRYRLRHPPATGCGEQPPPTKPRRRARRSGTT